MGVSFWPVLAVFTAIELQWGLGWFSPSNRILWMPLAVAALVCAAVAPFASRLSGSRRVLAVLLSVSSYGLGFLGALLVGVTYLHWGD